MIYYVPEQPVLLIVADEPGNDGVAGLRQGAVLEEKTAAADGSHYAVEKAKKLSSGRRLNEHPRDGDHVFVCDRGAGLPVAQLRTSLFGVACQGDHEFVDRTTLCPAPNAIENVERLHELDVDSCTRD